MDRQYCQDCQDGAKKVGGIGEHILYSHQCKDCQDGANNLGGLGEHIQCKSRDCQDGANHTGCLDEHMGTSHQFKC